jgi:pimeloyl-ACP methyl ester carboxylesterase
MPEQFCDVGRGITLCYETFGEHSDPPALLIMGLGTQMIAWQDDFCAQLASKGLYVVRFDNRDIGRSTHLQGPPPSFAQLLRGSGRAPHATRWLTWQRTQRAS